MSSTSPLLESVIALAHEAGSQIMAIYDTTFTVTEKDDASPLTAADLASHRCIVAGLQALTPDIPVLSEESASIVFADRQRWQRFWLVDPLDGTKEFIKRNGEFTVNIALIDGHDAILGVVHVPVQGVTYFASRGEGAFRREGDTTMAIQVAPRQHGPIRVVGSRSHGAEALQAFVASIGEHELVSIGSSLKLCLVAEGKADLYPRLGPTSEWDTAAAQCVVEVAGGQVIDLEGNPLRYNSKESLLNPYFLVCADPQRDWLHYLPSP